MSKSKKTIHRKVSKQIKNVRGGGKRVNSISLNGPGGKKKSKSKKGETPKDGGGCSSSRKTWTFLSKPSIDLSRMVKIGWDKIYHSFWTKDCLVQRHGGQGERVKREKKKGGRTEEHAMCNLEVCVCGMGWSWRTRRGQQPTGKVKIGFGGGGGGVETRRGKKNAGTGDLAGRKKTIHHHTRESRGATWKKKSGDLTFSTNVVKNLVCERGGST